MQHSSKHLLYKNFSHIYVEEKALSHPLTQKLLKKFSRASVITIKHYKEVFNRSNQDFNTQRLSANLILAIKDETFFYKGSHFSDAFEFENFYYAASVLGCLYDCHYCYLQGLYQSANSVIFVNIEAFIDSVAMLLDKPTLIATSYDTDTMAIESLCHHNSAWLEAATTYENLYLEIRTKSAAPNFLKYHTPNNKVTLAWTLSPQPIIDKYELYTPSLKSRLYALKQVMEWGWNVRICIDPVIYTDAFSTIYPQLCEEIFGTIDGNKLSQLTLGGFRMNNTHLSKLKKRAASDIAFYPYRVKEGIATYPEEIEQEILDTLMKSVCKHIDKNKIRTWSLQS